MTLIRKFLILFLVVGGIQTAHGADWIKQESNTLAWLRDIYFLDETKGFIAGSNGTFLTTADGGKSWKKSPTFVEDNLRQVYFSDDHNGWLLCERNIYNRGSNTSSYLLKTTDGGANWEQINFKDLGRERIAKIFFTTKNIGFAVGESGVIFAFRDGEKEWEKKLSPVRYLLLDGKFTDDLHGTIVGAGGSILFTEDAGFTWNKANVFGDSSTKFNSVFFFNQKTGWAVGTKGKIFQTLSGGKTWREQSSGVTKDLFDIFFVDSKEGWAVGDEGTILQTQTGGNVWIPVESKIKHKLEKVFFAGKKGFAVGFGGTILVYDKNYSSPKPTTILRRR